MKLDSRLQTLLGDLKTRKSQCVCGAVMYPRNWMKKTQERAKTLGLIEECNICSGDTCQYLKVNHDDKATV